MISDKDIEQLRASGFIENMARALEIAVELNKQARFRREQKEERKAA